MLNMCTMCTNICNMCIGNICTWSKKQSNPSPPVGKKILLGLHTHLSWKNEYPPPSISRSQLPLYRILLLTVELKLCSCIVFRTKWQPEFLKLESCLEPTDVVIKLKIFYLPLPYPPPSPIHLTTNVRLRLTL